MLEKAMKTLSLYYFNGFPENPKYKSIRESVSASFFKPVDSTQSFELNYVDN